MKNSLSSLQSNKLDIIIVCTVDGNVYGITKNTGKIQWVKRFESGPNIVITRDINGFNNGQDSVLDSSIVVNSKGPVVNTRVFVPEPITGDLYYLNTLNSLVKLDYSIKQLVNSPTPIHDDENLYTGFKKTSVYLINPNTGQVLRKYGEFGPIDCDLQELGAVYISVVEYNLEIWDKKSGGIVSRIKFKEYGPVMNSGFEKVGSASSELDSRLISETRFSAAVVGAFDVAKQQDGVLSIVKYQLNNINMNQNMNNRFVDSIQGSLYLLPAKSESTRDYSCTETSVGYPECLVGNYDVTFGNLPVLYSGNNSYVGNYSVVVILGIFGAWIIGLEIIRVFKTKYYKLISVDSLNDFEFNSSLGLESFNSTATILEPNVVEPSTSTTTLKSITVTENVLGYGSHGTVVLKGTFQGRQVAVKRMLAEFYSVADHEVKMLLESDEHPNVVRYYYKESCQGFTYMALELCAGTIHDYVFKKDIVEVHLLSKNTTLADIFWQICSGLQHLHGLNIVHRDIKPQNILISCGSGGGKMPRILISDFGLGKRLVEGQSSFHHTVASGGGPAGTIGWRAPECLVLDEISKQDGQEWL